MLVDLKQRVFGTVSSTADVYPPVRPILQEDGFYCDGRRYVHNPTVRMFRGQRQVNYVQFLEGRSEWPAEDRALVQKIVNDFML